MPVIYRIISLFLLMIIGVSCKEKQEKSDMSQPIEQERAPQETQANQPAQFSLTLKAMLKTDDQLQLFYIQEQSEGYGINQMITKDIVGSHNYQSITFELPKEDYPLNLRLDLGVNKNQGSISIEECILKYGNSSYVIKGEQFKEYFILNAGVQLATDAKTFYLKSFMEQGTEKYDPFMQGSPKLNEALLKSL